MKFDNLLVEKDEYIATIVLNRPDKKNSLSPDLLIELSSILSEFRNAKDVRVVVIRGAGGKMFSSGYDISSIPTKNSAELTKQNPLETAMQSIQNFPYPIIAMLNGDAFGAGLELAVSCDLRVGCENIRLGMPPVKLGVLYNISGLMRFVSVIGVSKTKEVFLVGRYFDAQHGMEIGLLDYLIHKDQLEKFTYELAKEITINAPLAVKGTKKILNMLSSPDFLSKEQKSEVERLIHEAFNSEDLKEAQRAFLEKRGRPIFKGI